MKAFITSNDKLTNKLVTIEGMESRMNTTQKSVLELRNEIDNWNNNIYKKATDKLYEVLGFVYDYYLANKDNKNAIVELKDELKNEKIKFSKNACFVSLISKYVFKNIDPKRVSTYKKTLVEAVCNNIDSGSKLELFIKNAGGIEKLRTNSTKNSQTMSGRASNAKQQIKNQNTIGIIQNDFFKSISTTGEDNIVVLVGYIDSTGAYKAKHVVFENTVAGLEYLPSKTVINAALSNMQTVNNNICKENAKKTVKQTNNTKKLAELS